MEQGVNHVEAPFIELNDGCAQTLVLDRVEIISAIQLSNLSKDQQSTLTQQLPDISAFLVNAGGSSGAARDAYGKSLGDIRIVVNCISQIDNMRFYVATDKARCTAGFNGATHTVHFEAVSAIPESIGGAAAVDRDVVVTCNSTYM